MNSLDSPITIDMEQTIHRPIPIPAEDTSILLGTSPIDLAPPVQNYRVDLTTDPWLPGKSHCPGLVARYTVELSSTYQGQVATIKIQTWSNIYKVHKFYMRNFAYTQLYMHSDSLLIRLFMKKGEPVDLMFENEDDLERAHDYFFIMLGR